MGQRSSFHFVRTRRPQEPRRLAMVCAASSDEEDRTYKTNCEYGRAWSRQAPCCPPCHRESVYSRARRSPQLIRVHFDIDRCEDTLAA